MGSRRRVLGGCYVFLTGNMEDMEDKDILIVTNDNVRL